MGAPRKQAGLASALGADELRAELLRRLATRGAAKRLAFEAGVTPSQLSRTAHGTIPPSETVAAAIGYRRVVRFERVE